MEYLELKPGWVIKVPIGMTLMDLAKYRFDPITLAIIAVSVGGGLQAVSTIQQGRAAEAQGRTQEAIAIRNAQLAERQAGEQRVAAAAEALRVEREGERLKGRQVALFAKSGVELRGTPLSVIIDSAVNIEADRLTILREGAIRAGTSRAQAGIFKAQGAAAKARGRATKRASILTAVGTGLSTVGSVGIASSRFSPDKGPTLQSSARRRRLTGSIIKNF